MAEYKPSPRAGDFSWKRELNRVTDDWPLAGRALQGMADGQRRALTELKQQLDGVEADAARERAPDLAALLRDHLAAAETADAASAREVLQRRTLAALVPDEVLMLRHLVALGQAPLAHIGVTRRPFGRARWRVLENATPLGRDAGVLLIERVDLYVRHLHSLGLVDELPANRQLNEGFERLRAETDVRETLETIRATPGQRARFQRRGLQPSVFARELLEAADSAAI